MCTLDVHLLPTIEVFLVVSCFAFAFAFAFDFHLLMCLHLRFSNCSAVHLPGNRALRFHFCCCFSISFFLCLLRLLICLSSPYFWALRFIRICTLHTLNMFRSIGRYDLDTHQISYCNKQQFLQLIIAYMCIVHCASCIEHANALLLMRISASSRVLFCCCCCCCCRKQKGIKMFSILEPSTQCILVVLLRTRTLTHFISIEPKNIHIHQIVFMSRASVNGFWQLVYAYA